MSSSSSPKRDAACQLVITCGTLLVVFSVFALLRPNGPSFAALRNRRELDLDQVSWHHCIDGTEYDNGGGYIGSSYHSRQCHFKNVCARLLPLEGSSDTDMNVTIELTYYKAPALIGGPRIWSTAQNRNDPWLMTDRNHYLRMHEVYEPLPQGAKFVKTPTVLMGSFWPHNFGHALGDDMYPAFRLLRQFSLVRPDNYYAFHQSCTQRGGWLGCKNAEALASTLSSRPYQQLGGELFPSTDELVCFADVVLGPNALTMRKADERAWPDMVTHMKAQVGIRPNAPLKKHKVVVIEKHGRRTWLNYGAVREHIEVTYGVETVLVDPATLSVTEQLELLEKTTVLLTPPGGVSFSSTFLHKGATAIYAEVWSSATGRSFPMDQEVYTRNADIHALFHPLVQSDLSLDMAAIDPGTKAQFNEGEIWRGYANVTINLDRLDLYLRDAFYHSSRAVGIRLPPGLRT